MLPLAAVPILGGTRLRLPRKALKTPGWGERLYYTLTVTLILVIHPFGAPLRTALLEERGQNDFHPKGWLESGSPPPCLMQEGQG